MTVPDAEKIAQLLATLRAAGIADERVLRAIGHVPRVLFLPPTFQERAYENIALPIGHGQTISQPYVVALMTEMLEVGPRHKVLEIGTGSGYQAAVLARLCRRVFTLERYRGLLKQAEARFAQLRLHNVTSRFGDGTKGWPEQAPFERIIVTAAAPRLPEALLDSLVEGGVLVAPVGQERRDQTLLRCRRRDGRIVTEELGPVRFVPLLPGLAREAAPRQPPA